MRRLLLGVVVAGALLLSPVAAVAATSGSSGKSTPAAPGLQLLSQTPWVQGPGLFTLNVGLTGASPADRLQVTVFYQVQTRSDFDHDTTGHVSGCCYYQRVAALSALPADGPGVDVQLPVNRPAPAHDPFKSVQIDGTGVYPVQVRLYDGSGRPLGTPLTTFIVFAQNAASAGKLHQLSVGLVIPVSSPPVVGPTGGMGTPGSGETSRLLRLAGVLNADSSVPASIAASPLTLDEVAAGGTAADRTLLGDLNGSTAGGPFEVLPSTYAPVSLGDLQQNGLAGEIDPQISTGSSVLNTVFGASTDGRTWVVDGPLDGDTLGVLIAHHVQQIIVPDEDLTPLPGEVKFTFAGSTYLDYGGSQLRVIAADTTLTSAFSRDESPVLAANQLLAELAMIYTETPNLDSPRGLAVLPPANWSASPDFVQTVLAGLQGNPLLSAVTASQLFADMGDAQGTRYLASGQPPPSTVDLTGSINEERTRIDELAQIYGASPELDQVEKQLLVAESSSLSDPQRRALLAAIDHATDQVQHIASLPPATTITLTSTKGQIPLTILVAGNAHPRIQLHLTSQSLIFRPFSPREGSCRVLGHADEICVLSLTSQNTTLHVPVETRSSGVFPLDVSLEVPGSVGKQPLQHDRDRVQSTAVSGVAVIVIIVALAGLVLWWGRDLRRGRRPKGMAPSPVDVTVGDPHVDGFFEQSRPEFGDGDGRGAAMSPSPGGGGPSSETNGNGQARETRKM